MDNNANIPAELQLPIEEILINVDELNNPDAVLFCGNAILKKVSPKETANVNDYSSFIPAY